MNDLENFVMLLFSITTIVYIFFGLTTHGLIMNYLICIFFYIINILKTDSNIELEDENK